MRTNPNQTDTVDAICREIISSPLVVIGGKSRSGKSTFSEKLAAIAISEGKSAAVVHIDAYLGGPGYTFAVEKPLGQLPISTELALKFAYSRIGADVSRLMQREPIRPPVYDRPTKRRTAEHGDTIMPADVLIVEGTPALCVPDLLLLPSIRIYLIGDEQERERELMHDWMVVKGISQERAEALLRYRREHEERFIDESGTTAAYHFRRQNGTYSLIKG
jgi:uridine kinase